MTDLRFIEIPKIQNEDVFEELICELIRSEVKYESVNLNGRTGQGQDGIDIYARLISTGQWIGIQCKVRATNKSFTKKDIVDEIDKARLFNPRISEYYLFTTLNRDAKTQELYREIVDELNVSSSFTFHILFWEDIEAKLKEKQFETVYYRYYYKYVRDNQHLGHAISKLINLDLQFDNKSDSHYELMVGKIPEYKDNNHSLVNYYRGTYFIANLLENKVENFGKSQTLNRPVCFPSDIQAAFSNNIDCFRISKWLSSIEDIDDFIYNDVHNYTFSITSTERDLYLHDDDEV